MSRPSRESWGLTLEEEGTCYSSVETFLGEDSMRLVSLSVTLLLALLSSHTLAQQSPGTTGDTIGRPPPIPGPPPISEPSSTTQPAPAASTPPASDTASK